MIKLSQNDIEVVSITFDGDKAHAKACEVLGANFNYRDKNNFKSYFEHLNTLRPVYVFFDPCHALKLVRNYLALKGPIIYDTKIIIIGNVLKNYTISKLVKACTVHAKYEIGILIFIIRK